MFLVGNVKNGDGSWSSRVRQVNPATGQRDAGMWQASLPSNALGNCTVNDNDIIACAGMDWGWHSDNGIFLIDSATGNFLDTDPNLAGSQQLKDPADASSDCLDCALDQFSQPIWANGLLWMSTQAALSPWKVVKPASDTAARSLRSQSLRPASEQRLKVVPLRLP
jgi:hypothetical protein